jgi:hypothetical protein
MSSCLDADQAVGCCASARGGEFVNRALEAVVDGLGRMTCLQRRNKGALSDRCSARLACCSAGGGGTGSGGAGKITLVLIKLEGSDLQADLASVYVDRVAARGRDGGPSADKLLDMLAECPAHERRPHKLRYGLE